MSKLSGIPTYWKMDMLRQAVPHITPPAPSSVPAHTLSSPHRTLHFGILFMEPTPGPGIAPTCTSGTRQTAAKAGGNHAAQPTGPRMCVSLPFSVGRNKTGHSFLFRCAKNTQISGGSDSEVEVTEAFCLQQDSRDLKFVCIFQCLDLHLNSTQPVS